MTDCLACGACCRCLFFAFTGEIEKTFLEGRGGQYVIGKLVFPLKCKYLDEKTNKCAIYENRPAACSSFKKGSMDCRRCIKWQEKILQGNTKSSGIFIEAQRSV